jgi:PAS domain S-box-containing protein
VRTVETQSSNHVLGSILLFDAEAKRLRHGAAPSLPDDYNAAIDGIAVGPAVGSCGTAAFTGKTVVVSDIETDPLWADFKDLARKHGLRACWSTPISSVQGAVLGTFALYHRVPMIPAARDREIVQLLGHTAALVLERDQQARKQAAADAALRLARDQQIKRVSVMFQHAPAAIAVVRGPEHVFEVANPKYGELVGDRPLMGKTVREAFPELEGQGFFELLDNVYRTGEPYIGRAQRVLLRRGADGALDEGFVDFVYQPIPGPDGKTDSILAVAFEITEIVRAKIEAESARARAEASEHSLKTFIDNLPELAWTAQPDGHIDYYNRRWYDYTGTTFEEMQGWGWEKVHDPELLPKVVERWKHSLATGEPFEMEFTLRGADGIPRWFLTRVTPARDAAGKITRWFGTNTNIHEIKAAQALTDAVAEQSRETQSTLLQMRAAVERAEGRIAELEAERQMRAQ